MAIAFSDRDLRNIDIRDYTEKEVGARVRAEIKDITEIINRIISLGMSHTDIEGNSHQLEDRGTTGRITIRTIKRSIDIMNHTELQRSSKIREEAQIITIIPSLLPKIKVDIVDLVLVEIVYRENMITL